MHLLVRLLTGGHEMNALSGAVLQGLYEVVHGQACNC